MAHLDDRIVRGAEDFQYGADNVWGGVTES